MQHTDVQVPVRRLPVNREAYPAKATFDLRKRLQVGEGLIQTFLFLCGALSIATTLGIVVV